LYDKRMSQEVEGEALGDEYKGYIFKITGGNDKQGFPMKQGVLVSKRVRLLLKKGDSCFRERKKGERKRKSVRGCIVGPDLAVVNLVVLKKGEAEIEGVTDRKIPLRLGPKRASKIRKLFNLSKDDDVTKYVIKRKILNAEGKVKKIKTPKIQRLVTPLRIQRKRRLACLKRKRIEKSKSDAAEYARLLALRRNQARAALISKKSKASGRPSQKISVKVSQKTSAKESAEPPKKAAKPAEAKGAKSADAKGAKPKAVAKAVKGAVKAVKADKPKQAAAKAVKGAVKAVKADKAKQAAAKAATKKGDTPKAKAAPTKAKSAEKPKADKPKAVAKAAAPAKAAEKPKAVPAKTQAKAPAVPKAVPKAQPKAAKAKASKQ